MPSKRLPREWWAGYLLISPFFIFFAAFTAYPLYFAFRLSFTNWRGVGELKSVGLSNYTFLLTNSDFWSALGNTGVLWLLIVPLQTLGSVALAAALARTTVRLVRVLRTAVLIPYVTPLAAMTQAFILILDQNFGVANHLLGLLGLGPIGWLTTPEWSKPAIALLVLWKTSGFSLIIMLAAIQAIPTEVYEAASMDGAGRIRTFFSITVPLVMRTISFFVVIATLGVTQMFLEPYVLTAGGPYNSSTTSGLYLFNFIRASDLGTGAANTFLLVIIMLVLSLVAARLLKSRED